jgi:hypothetical protein
MECEALKIGEEKKQEWATERISDFLLKYFSSWKEGENPLGVEGVEIDPFFIQANKMINNAFHDVELSREFSSYLSKKVKDIKDLLASPFSLCIHFMDFRNEQKEAFEILLSALNATNYVPPQNGRVKFTAKSAFFFRKMLIQCFPRLKFPGAGQQNICKKILPGNSSGKRVSALVGENRLIPSLKDLKKIVRECYEEQKHLYVCKTITLTDKKTKLKKKAQVLIKDSREKIGDLISKIVELGGLEFFSEEAEVFLKLWIDSSYVCGSSELKMILNLLLKNTKDYKFNVLKEEVRILVKQMHLLLLTFAPEGVETFNELVESFAEAVQQVQSPFEIKLRNEKIVKVKLSIKLLVADLKSGSLSLACKGANSLCPCPVCIIARENFTNVKEALSAPLRSPTDDIKLKEFIEKNPNFKTLLLTDDLMKKRLFQDTEGVPIPIELMICMLHLLQNQFGLWVAFFMDLMTPEKKLWFAQKIYDISRVTVDQDNNKNGTGSMIRDLLQIHTQFTDPSCQLFEDKLLCERFFGFVSNFGAFIHESYSSLLPTNRSFLMNLAYSVKHLIYLEYFEKQYNTEFTSRQTESEASDINGSSSSTQNSQNTLNPNYLETQKLMSKLYPHILLSHFPLMLRKVAPQNAEGPESSWRIDRVDLKHHPVDSRFFVVIWKQAIRERISQNKIHSNDDHQSHSTLPNSVFFESWMTTEGDMLLSRGECRDLFFNFLRWCSDVDPRYLKWDYENNTLTIICEEKPDDGPDDLIMEMNTTEDQALKIIEEKSGQVYNGTSPFFVNKGGVYGCFKRRSNELWVYDHQQIETVPMQNKERFIGFLKKNGLNHLLCQDRNGNDIIKAGDAVKFLKDHGLMDEYLKRIIEDHSEEWERLIPHMTNL